LGRDVKTRGEQVGILGLGYSVREASARRIGIRYPYFVETLVNAGQIASRLYSLYLANLGQYSSIVFGDVDTLNCLPHGDIVDNFWLMKTNVTMVDGNETATELINRTNTQLGVFD
jgi:hypothetical protein